MESSRLFCTFRLGGQLFGVDMLEVKEVTTETDFTPIAHAPEEVLGLVNIRGHIHLVIDLRCLLGMPNANLTGNSRLVLFKSSVGNAFGVVVDEILEIHHAKAEHIEAFHLQELEPHVFQVQRVELVAAICRLPHELLVVLNPRRFLTVVEQSLANSA